MDESMDISVNSQSAEDPSSYSEECAETSVTEERQNSPPAQFEHDENSAAQFEGETPTNDSAAAAAESAAAEENLPHSDEENPQFNGENQKNPKFEEAEEATENPTSTEDVTDCSTDESGLRKTVATQTVVSASNFILVLPPGGEQSKKQHQAIEMQLDKNGELSLDTLRAGFPNAASIKYRNPDSGIMRILKQENGFIAPPPEGWGKTAFIVCITKDTQGFKRPFSADSGSTPSKQAKMSRGLLRAPALAASMGAPMNSMPMGASVGLGNLPVQTGMNYNTPTSRALLSSSQAATMLGPQAMMSMTGGGPPGPNVYTNAYQQQQPPAVGQYQYNNGMDLASMQYTETMPPTYDPMSGGGYSVPPPNNTSGGGSGGLIGNYPTSCDLCHVQMNSPTQAQLHFEGKRHADALIQMQNQMISNTYGSPYAGSVMGGGYHQPMSGGGYQPMSGGRGGGRAGLLGRGGGHRGGYNQHNSRGGGGYNNNKRNGPAGGGANSGRGGRNDQNPRNNQRRGFRFRGNNRGRGGARPRNGSAAKNNSASAAADTSKQPPQQFDNDDWSTGGTFNDFSSGTSA